MVLDQKLDATIFEARARVITLKKEVDRTDKR
jgi:hypothetical protein